MRISDVKTYVLGTAWRNLTYVELHTDEGLVGVGEVRMLNHTDTRFGYVAEVVPTTPVGLLEVARRLDPPILRWAH